MGRKKGSKNKIKRRQERYSAKRKTIGTSIAGGFLVAIACIFFVFFRFANIGMLGTLVNEACTWLLGIAKYGIPVVLIYVGAHAIVSDKKVKIGVEIFQGILATISVSALLYAFSYERFNLFENFIEYTKWGATCSMSGVIGAYMAALVYQPCGIIVTKMVFIATTILSIFYFFKISFIDFCIGVYTVIAKIITFIIHMCIIVFGQDEEKKRIREERKKLKEEEKKKRELEKQESMKQAQMATVGSRNYASNIKDDDSQLSIDLSDNASKQKYAQAKEQRDEYFKKQREISDEKNIKEVLQLDHLTHEQEELNYSFPPVSLLNEPKATAKTMNKKAADAVANKLEKTLASFGVEAKVTNITKGPTVMCYELTPAVGVKVSRIVSLTDDIALNLAAKSIRIEAPIPGKGTVGIEVPNDLKESVYIKDIIASKMFEDSKSKLTFALGKDIAGENRIGDLSKMPHVLVAGATGSGKSVCINSMLVSILYKAKPSEVKLILIDPKMVEMTAYNGIPHLLIPVVTDPKKAAGALTWAVSEMVDRYTKFAAKGVKDIIGYNKLVEAEEGGKKLPQIVIVIDELSDLMMVAPNDVEDAICRLAQMARAAGMYLVIATQRPSVDVITGVIKANIPSRIAFTVSSQVDSRTILDMAGAEKLLGKGDMLYYPTGEVKPERIQGAFVSEQEVDDIVRYIKGNSHSNYNQDVLDKIENGSKQETTGKEEETDVDVLLDNAIDLAVDMGQASASMLQRRFKVGYARAGRIVDQMEARGIISGYDGSKPRQVLISKQEWQELKMGTASNNNMQQNDEQNNPVISENEIQKPVEGASTLNSYDKMLMEKLQKRINTDSMFYDEDT